MISLYTKIDTLSLPEKRKLCKYGIRFCRKKFGNSKPKIPLSISIKRIDDDSIGSYDYKQNQIILSPDIHDVKEFIMTFIHEYVHSTQDICDNYSRLFQIHGPDEHPYEIEAEKACNEYYKSFWRGYKNSHYYKTEKI